MQITPSTLKALNNGLNTAFKKGIDSVESQHKKVAMHVQSSTALENYGFMKDLPGVREFLGQRVVNNLESVVYQIINKTWEHTIGISREAIEDDRLGTYSLAFSQQGEIVARHPDLLNWELLLKGFATLALDGQFYFDTDHISYDENGAEISWSNTQAGGTAPWFLMDLSRSFMLPMIEQIRTAVEFVSKNKSDDDNVFMNNEFIYGTYARYNAGFGFYQLAYASKDALNAVNYELARKQMMIQRRPDGSTLNVQPTHLLVGPSHEAEARELILNKELAGGGSNKWAGTVEIMVVPGLG